MKNILVSFSLFIGLSTLLSAQDEPIKVTPYLGDLSARQIGPALMSGRVIDLEAHPSNARIFYVGSAGGGVWKTQDGGVSFNPVFDDHCQSIGAIEVDPNDPDNTIYVGTGEIWTRNSVSIGDGLYRSTDGGSNWAKLGFENSERIASIIVNPKNAQEIYVGVLGALWSDSEERGVYKSTDGGATWSKILYVDETTGCADMTMDPNDPNTLYASMWEFRRTAWSFNSGGDKSALYKSTDGGKSWNKIHNGFPEGKLGRLAIAVAPSNPQVLYTVIEAEKDERKGLYGSDDGGANWTQLNNDFGITVRPFYFSRISVDPRDENVVVKAGLSGSISRDGGKTFKNLGSMHADIHDVIFGIEDSDRMYSGTDGGVYRSYNGGTTFELSKDLPLSQFYHISIDDAEPYNIYGGLQDNGSWGGPSRSGGGIKAADWISVGFGDGFRVLKHPTKNIIYSEMQGAESVWRYDGDKEVVKTVQPLAKEGDPKLRFNWNAPMATSPHNSDRFYMGSQFLHRSNDMGNTWEIISPDLTTNDKSKQNQEDSGGLSKDNSGAENHTTIFTITESPLNENIIWVGTDDGNVQISRDGGQSWENTTPNIQGLPTNTWVYHIEASVHGEGIAYAVFDGHTKGDMKPYAYKTTDFGKTWTNIISDDIPVFARSIQEDFENENVLFLGTEMGLYVTLDAGKSWSRYDKNVPPVAIHHLELHAKTNDLVLGTHGRGVIIVDDISPLREINEENLAKKLHFFESQPFVMVESSGGFGSSSGFQTEWIGSNPTTSAEIKYILPKRHVFGKMTMEIQDMDGNKIVPIDPGKNKGVNTVNWGYSMKTPKIAKGKTFSFSGFTAPQVPAGQYKAVITKGKEVYEHVFTVENDPEIGLSKQQYDLKHKTTMKAYDMTQDLAYMVYQIDTYHESLVKTNKKLAAQFNELKETLVVTTGDNYVGAAEPQLREKMADLYAKLAGSYDVPSQAELDNLEAIEKRFENAKSSFEKLQKKIKTEMVLLTFEAFIDS